MTTRVWSYFFIFLHEVSFHWVFSTKYNCSIDLEERSHAYFEIIEQSGHIIYGSQYTVPFSPLRVKCPFGVQYCPKTQTESLTLSDHRVFTKLESLLVSTYPTYATFIPACLFHVH